MDWTGCEFVERVEGRCGGVPTVVGTRVPPEIIIQCLDDGLSREDIWEDYPSLTPDQIQGLIAFVQAKRSAA